MENEAIPYNINQKNILIMAATKFSVITKGEKPTFHVLVQELPGEYSYKIALEIAKAVIPTDHEIIAVVESWKLYPKKDEKTKK